MATRFDSARCRVAFTLPDHWTARTTWKCDVEVRPPRWSAKVKRSRFLMPDPPLTLFTFERGTSFGQALGARSFDLWSAVGDYTAGEWSGRTGSRPTRIYLRPGVRPRNDDEPTGILKDVYQYVLKGRGGRIIAFECQGGSPDERFDCQGAVRRIVATLRLRWVILPPP